MIEYGIQITAGHVIVGPGWTCVADVMASMHGHVDKGAAADHGTLVRRLDGAEWEPVQ